jgi:hypothetical protein
MSLKNRNVGRRAWNILRLSLLWARKSGVFRRKLVTELRLVPKYLKCLGHKTTPAHHIHYFERELSFDETPMFNVKMYRPSSMRFLLPCINPDVDFDYDFNDDDDVDNDDGDDLVLVELSNSDAVVVDRSVSINSITSNEFRAMKFESVNEAYDFYYQYGNWKI